MALTQKLRRSQRQETLIGEMALRIRQYTQLDAIATAIVEEVQHFLAADRVVVYQFQPDMSGTIVAEAVVTPWLPCLNVQINDTLLLHKASDGYSVS
ncbi:MAG: hypothetical protein O3A14_15120 [Cyanobacteria bacterium]|nr:hypothetical protein [Cyanobacteriota bacterium]